MNEAKASDVWQLIGKFSRKKKIRQDKKKMTTPRILVQGLQVREQRKLSKVRLAFSAFLISGAEQLAIQRLLTWPVGPSKGQRGLKGCLTFCLLENQFMRVGNTNMSTSALEILSPAGYRTFRQTFQLKTPCRRARVTDSVYFWLRQIMQTSFLSDCRASESDQGSFLMKLIEENQLFIC